MGLLVICYSAFSSPTAPGGPSEATYRLQAESLVRDGDRAYGEADRARFAAKNWPAIESAIETTAEVSVAGDALHFHRPLPYSLALAPFVLIAPERGPLLLNLLLFGGLAIGLGLRLGRDAPGSAPYWSVALFFGTVVFSYVRAAWPELFVSALLVLAYLLTREGAPPEELPQMAAKPSGRWKPALRWLTVGCLVAAAALQGPLYAVALMAFLVPAFRSRNEVAWAAAIGGFAGVLLGAWLLGGTLFPGVAPWLADTGLPVRAGDEIVDVGDWALRLESVEAPPVVWDPELMLWNGVYALVGRHVGVLLCFVPLVFFGASARWSSGLLWLVAGGVLVGSIVLDPFNFAGGPESLGNRPMVPLAVLMFFAVRASAAAWPAILAGAAGMVAVAPLWLGLTEHPGRLRAQVAAASLARVLPYETSQRYAPASGEVFSRLILARTANGGLLPGSGPSHFVLRYGMKGELMVASSRRLSAIELEFGPNATSELELEGGTVENLLFRPGGGVTFEVAPNEPRIRHRIWGRDDRHFLHMLEFSMTGADGDQPFSVTGVPAGVAPDGQPGGQPDGQIDEEYR